MACLSPATAGAQQRVEPVAGLTDPPDAVVAGPDSAMWVSVEANPGRILRITPAGEVTQQGVGGIGGFPVNRHPSHIVSHGGALWFVTSGGPQSFARLNVFSPFAGFSLTYGRPTALASGPDGALWMTVDAGPLQPDAITRFTPDPRNEMTRTLQGQTEPRQLTAGPDGALWFMEADRLGRITPSGMLSYRTIGGAALTALASDSTDLWYAQGSAVRRLDGPTTHEIGSPTSALAVGPDGAMWAGIQGGVVRIVAGEDPTTVPLAPAARAIALAAGPDGRLWAALDRDPYLVKITVPPAVGDIAQDDGAVSARIKPNGLTTTVKAELRRPDGSWFEVARTQIDATATIRLPLPDLAPGEHVARVTATNTAGSTSSRPLTIVVSEPEPTATATPVATVSPTPTPTVTPTSTPGPVEGKSVEVAVVSGEVSYRVPPETTYTAITGSVTLPLGVLLDTTDGKVRVASQVDGKAQTATFNGGKFTVAQTSTGMTEMALAGPLQCTASERATTSAKPKKKKKRSLWGKDSGGSFRTRGNGSVATVRGTEWRTEDTCAGTTIYVRQGAVSVWPRRGGRSTLLHAGQRLFSPRP
ncbi:Vgb family protein [Solirubrobacter soli]|uniref:Vgb family protein n=1 Tax=Solirubrobacter soli TaxID=363832 RepID=UPI0012F9C857|nr:hypothetical protein [Solirubrobacter soli]